MGDDVKDTRIALEDEVDTDLIPKPKRILKLSTPFAEEQGQKVQRFNVNMYATKKTLAQGALDLSLLMANASQLKYILTAGSNHRFYEVMLALLIGSVILQVIVGLLLMFLAKLRVQEEDEAGQLTARALEAALDAAGDADVEVQTTGPSPRMNNTYIEFLNNTTVGTIFLITVVNVFISSFGLNAADYPSMSAGSQTSDVGV